MFPNKAIFFALMNRGCQRTIFLSLDRSDSASMLLLTQSLMKIICECDMAHKRSAQSRDFFEKCLNETGGTITLG